MKCPPSPTQEQIFFKRRKKRKEQHKILWNKRKTWRKDSRGHGQEIIIEIYLFWRLKALYNLMKNMQGTNTHVQINGI